MKLTKREHEIVQKCKDGWNLIVEHNFIALEHPKGNRYDYIRIDVYNHLYIKGVIYQDMNKNYEWQINTKYYEHRNK